MPDAQAEQACAEAQYWQDIQQQLRRFVANRVTRDAVDDVVGDLTLKLVTHRDALRKTNNPPAWIHRVAMNAVTDHYRRRATESRLHESAAQEMSTDVAGPETTDKRAETDIAQCLTPLIDELPARDAEALRLVSIEGLSQVEAARQLNIPVSTMKSRVQRARLKLRDSLVNCCDFAFDRLGTIIDYEQRAESKRPCGC